jgi:hypothetical protein
MVLCGLPNLLTGSHSTLNCHIEAFQHLLNADRHSTGCDIRDVRVDTSQREQGQTYITYFDQHSMQGGLVNHWASEDGFSIVH